MRVTEANEHVHQNSDPRDAAMIVREEAVEFERRVRALSADFLTLRARTLEEFTLIGEARKAGSPQAEERFAVLVAAIEELDQILRPGFTELPSALMSFRDAVEQSSAHHAEGRSEHLRR